MCSDASYHGNSLRVEEPLPVNASVRTISYWECVSLSTTAVTTSGFDFLAGGKRGGGSAMRSKARPVALGDRCPGITAVRTTFGCPLKNEYVALCVTTVLPVSAH